MKKSDVKPCCDMFIPFAYETRFVLFAKPLYVTLLCCGCRKKMRARTAEKLLEKWNSSVEDLDIEKGIL